MTKKDNVGAGKRIKALREKHRLTQGQLAERVGAHRQRVIAWEAGTSGASGENLLALSRVLDVAPEYIQYGSGGEVAASGPADEGDTPAEVIMRDFADLERLAGRPTKT